MSHHAEWEALGGSTDMGGIRGALSCIGDNSKLASNHASELITVYALFSLVFGAIGTYAARYSRTSGKSMEYASRIPSIVHAMLACLSCGGVLVHGVVHQEPYGSPTTCQQGMALMISNAYFSVDLVGILTSNYFDVIFVLHHLACLTGNMWTVVAMRTGHFQCLVSFLLEVTGPFMHVHWMNVHDRRIRGAVYQTCRVGYLISFTLARGIFGPWLIWEALKIDNYPILMVGLGVAFFILSMRELMRIFAAELRGELWQS